MIDSEKNVVEKMMEVKVAGARAGNVRDAAIAAALIHRHSDLARKLGINSQYDGLLSQALLSEDAELVVCVGEELVKGKNLAANAALAQRFFNRAETLSPFMGAYVLARLVSSFDTRQATHLFARAQKAGHIPSAICRHRIISKKILVGFFIGIVFGIYDFVLTWRTIRAGHSFATHFWRYRDVFPTPLEPVDKEIGIDRANIFGELGG